MANRVEPHTAPLTMRRKSVSAEVYDPEKDDQDESARSVFPKSEEQIRTLTEAVKNILMFRRLEPEQMQELLDAMFEKTVNEGEVVFKQGDDGDDFYVIKNGIFQVFVQEGGKQPVCIHTYENTGCFGELALLYNMPRAATIKAVTEGTLWTINRQTFRRIMLKASVRRRKMYESLIEAVPILKGLQSYERMDLADALVSKEFGPNENIIKQGDVADGMYFVEFGTVSIMVRDNNGKEVEINRVENGGYFGELALITNQPRAASVYSVDSVKLAFLEVGAFERLLGPCMHVMKRNIEDYEEQMIKIFGSKPNLNEVR